MRAVIFAAVSTTQQAAEEKASIPEQLNQARALCQHRNWQIVDEIVLAGQSRNYTDLNELISDSPDYGRMIQHIRQETTDLIVTRDYDRLYRTRVLQAVLSVICEEHHVQVYSLNQPIEPVPRDQITTNDTRVWTETIFGLMAEQENRTRTRRRMLGMKRRIERGLGVGGQITPYGYMDVGKDKPWIINEEEAQWVRRIFHWRTEELLSTTGIASRLNRQHIPSPAGTYWNTRTLCDLLSNSVYYGAVHYGKFHNDDGLHEAIVSRTIWDRAQQIKLANGGRTDPTYALAGLLRCSYCHHAMVRAPKKYKGKRIEYLQCSLYSRNSPPGIRQRLCQSNCMRMDPVEQFVDEAVRHVLSDPNAFVEMRRESLANEEYTGELSRLENSLVALQERFNRWNYLYEVGRIEENELFEHRDQIESQSVEHRGRIAQLRRLLANQDTAGSRALELADQLDKMDAMSVQELHQLYAALIDQIVLTRECPPQIQWR